MHLYDRSHSDSDPSELYDIFICQSSYQYGKLKFEH